MIPIQYDLFEENDEETLFKKSVNLKFESYEKRFRSLFALMKGLEKEYIASKEENYELRMMMIQRKK